MPARQQSPRELLVLGLRRMRDDIDALQRQQLYVIVDPTEASGDPANGYAVLVIGPLDEITGISGYGAAVYDDAASTWVKLDGGGGPFTYSQTYAWTGGVFVLSGAAGYFPPTFIPVPGSQAVSLVGATYQIRNGTSATFTVYQNGVAIGALTGLVAVDTGPTTTTSAVAIADGDAINLAVTAVAGSPDGLSVSLLFEVTP